MVLCAAQKIGDLGELLRNWICACELSPNGVGNFAQLCTRKKVEVLIHTPLQPGDRARQENGNRFERFPILAPRSSPG